MSRAVFLLLGLFGLACSGQPAEEQPEIPGDPAPPLELVEGGLYSVQDEGGFGLVKLLVVEPEAAHVRIYTNSYPSRPQQIDPRELSMTGGGQQGIGHLPLSRATFAGWDPRLVQVEPVSPEELEGYQMWKEAGGGLF